jgi:hypothetical protein
VRVAPWPLDFLGGAQMPHAPKIVTFIPRLWGYLPVYRGTGSRTARVGFWGSSLREGIGLGSFARRALGRLIWPSIQGLSCCP